MNLIKFNFLNNDFKYSLFFQEYLTKQIGLPDPDINKEHDEYSQFFEVINNLVKKDRLILDIGAHCGLVCIPLCLYGYEVVAFEPVKSNIDCLIKGVESNNIKNLKISTTAVSDENIDSEIFVPNSEDCSSLNISSLDVLKDKSYSVQNVTCIKLDDYIKLENIDPKKIGLVKIDVQGLEHKVINGMLDILKNSEDIILILEWDYRQSGDSLNEIIKIFNNLSIKEISENNKFYSGNKLFKKIIK